MNLFYASFIPGLQNVIADVIRDRLAQDVKILKLLDGAVLFETETSYDKLNFFCFNNIFAGLNVINEQTPGNKIVPEKHIRKFINDYTDTENIIANNSKSFKTFRVVFSNENVPAAVDEKLRLDAEHFISSISGLKVNRSLPDAEFWFLFRREKEQSFFIFMKRLTLRRSWEKTLHKGELPPPLAWTMCRLANLVYSDTVLDPFCGYGSIPDAALKYFHITKFIACDKTREAADYAEARFKKRKSGGFILYKNDFNELPSLLEEKSIDAIVTDPPWGHYKINDKTFLVNMFDVCGRLLKTGGRAVVLYANDDEFLKAVPDCFELQEKIPILLSGKKAVIYKLILKA